MSHNPKLTLIGLYNYYGSDLFANLSLPAIVDRDTAINSLLLTYGEQRLIYPDGDFMKQAIGVWSAKWQATIEKIAAALEAEYNPIHNYDRFEEYSDSETMTQEGGSTGTTEDKVSAYNATDYQPDAKSESAGTTSNESSRTFDHNAHLYGNIGVTTSQQMLEAEVNLRVNQNVYDVISDLFFREFCTYDY